MAVEQKPSVGRIVHFKADNGEILPAIVTGVNDNGTINLRVFTNNEHNHLAPLLKGVEQGKKERQWSWPPRAGE